MGITLFLKTRGLIEIASAFFLVQLYLLSITQSDTSDNKAKILYTLNVVRQSCADIISFA